METNNKIGFMEALGILLIVVFAHLILLLPKIIIEDQGTGSIINIIYGDIFLIEYFFTRK